MSKILKISGTAEIPEDLSLDTDYLFRGLGSVSSQKIVPNHDGTNSNIFTLKLLTCELKKGEKSFKAKVQNKKSQILRQAIWISNRNFFPEIDEEEFYNRTIDAILANLEPIILRIWSKK